MNNKKRSDKEFFALTKKYAEASYHRANDGSRFSSMLISFLRNFVNATEEKKPDSKFYDMRVNRVHLAELDLFGLDVNTFKSRMKALLEDSDEWEEEFNKTMSDTVKSVDTNKYVHYCRNGRYYSKEKDILIDFDYEDYDNTFQVFLYTKDTKLDVNALATWFNDFFLNPSPYKGKVVKIVNNNVEILDTHLEKTSPYDDKVEASVKWLTSVTDEEVAQKLSDASLPGHAGLLLEGPPGSGKTTLVRRIIHDENQKGTSVIIYGGGSSIDKIFTMAETILPCLVVLEDVESIFGGRGDASFSESLNAMDGVKRRNGLMVLATTNNSKKLDPAVVRPGRLEEHAVIAGINENAYHNLIVSRLSWKTEEEVMQIVEALRQVAGKEVITPAMVDSLSRNAIMRNFSQNDFITFITKEWNPKFEGTDYTV